MARPHTTTVREALSRWDGPRGLAVEVDMQSNEFGLWNASMRIRSRAGEVNLTVTGVEIEAGYDSAGEAHRAFDRLCHAAGDATVLAAEVRRLTEQVRQLQQDT
jgi:hypothetical protein